MIYCGSGSVFEEYYSSFPGKEYNPQKSKHPAEPKHKDTHRETEEEKNSSSSYSGGYSPDSN